MFIDSMQIIIVRKKYVFDKTNMCSLRINICSIKKKNVQ